jgi:hypothetical protein
MQFDPQKKNNLIVIEKPELRKYWSLVRPALEKMQKDRKSADKWTPEDVYLSLLEGRSTLVLTSIVPGENTGLRYADRETAIQNFTGFMVLQKTSTYEDAALHIWIAASNEGKAEASNILTFNSEMDELAKNIGCTRITFNSNRDFWKRVAPRFRFEELDVKWSRDVK